MRLKSLVLLAALVSTPAIAQSSCEEKHRASSCEQGFQWDTETGKCVQVVSS